jgi:Rrf2 family protein
MFYKETEYALRGLVYIQKQNSSGRRPGIEEIAEEIEAPQYYIAKILQRMVKHGFISSAKGRGGGFFFEKDKPDLHLIDVVSFTEGTKTFSGCGFGLKNCNNNSPCPLHHKYTPVRDALFNLLSGETIRSLAEKDNT